MTYRIEFTPVFRADLAAACDWYDVHQPGLSSAFKGEVKAVVARIAIYPLVYQPVFRTVRRARLRRFPYGLFFRIDGDLVLLLACFHTSRSPAVWQARIPPS